jgi:hypothetical protein
MEKVQNIPRFSRLTAITPPLQKNMIFRGKYPNESDDIDVRTLYAPLLLNREKAELIIRDGAWVGAYAGGTILSKKPGAGSYSWLRKNNKENDA